MTIILAFAALIIGLASLLACGAMAMFVWKQKSSKVFTADREGYIMIDDDGIHRLAVRWNCEPPVLVDENDVVVAQLEYHDMDDKIIPFN